MRGHTGKGVLLGSEGCDEGILLFLGWARWESRLLDWFGSRRRSNHSRRRHNLRKGFPQKGAPLFFFFDFPGQL